MSHISLTSIVELYTTLVSLVTLRGVSDESQRSLRRLSEDSQKTLIRGLSEDSHKRTLGGLS